MHLFLLAMTVLLTVLSGCTSEEGKKATSIPEEHVSALDIDTRLLETASKEPQVASFIAENPGYRYEITVLAPEDIEGLATKYPVIYEDLPDKTLYKIDYIHDKGMLVIIDLDKEEVLKYFRTSGVSLG